MIIDAMSPSADAVHWQRRYGVAAVCAGLILVTLVPGCALAPAARDGALYIRLGGMPTLTAVSDEVIDFVAADPKTKRSFEGVKLATLKQNLAIHLCSLTGGPCKYEGENMRKAHQGLKITDSEFDRLVAATRAALDKRVGEREKNELLRLLAPFKREVVGA